MTLEVNLVPGEERPFTAAEFKEAWRELAGEFPGAESVIFSSEAGRLRVLRWRCNSPIETRAACRWRAGILRSDSRASRT